MHKQITEQRRLIAEKENLIKKKHEQLKETGDQYELKLKDLAVIYD